MKRNIAILISLFLIFNCSYLFAGKNKKKPSDCCCCSCSAQKAEKALCREHKFDPEMKKKMHEEFVEKLSKELNLTKEQRENVDKILKEGWDEMKAKKEQMKKEMQEMREAKNSKIKESLDEKQKVKFDEITQKMKEKFEAGKMHKND